MLYFGSGKKSCVKKNNKASLMFFSTYKKTIKGRAEIYEKKCKPICSKRQPRTENLIVLA